MAYTEVLAFVGKFAGYFVTTVLGAGVGAFFGSYLRKKGENWATHEDIDKLVDQMKAVTLAQKEIEAKISNEMWERQRKWEVKREALFEAMKEIGSVEYALINLIQTYATARTDLEPNTPDRMREKSAATGTWNTALVSFKKTKLLAILVCGQELRDAFAALEQSIIAYASETVSGDHGTTSFATVRQQMDALIQSVRRELHVDETELMKG
jgi:hypothetical protein